MLSKHGRTWPQTVELHVSQRRQTPRAPHLGCAAVHLGVRGGVADAGWPHGAHVHGGDGLGEQQVSGARARIRPRHLVQLVVAAQRRRQFLPVLGRQLQNALEVHVVREQRLQAPATRNAEGLAAAQHVELVLDVRGRCRRIMLGGLHVDAQRRSSGDAGGGQQAELARHAHRVPPRSESAAPGLDDDLSRVHANSTAGGRREMHRARGDVRLPLDEEHWENYAAGP